MPVMDAESDRVLDADPVSVAVRDDDCTAVVVTDGVSVRESDCESERE